MHQDMMSNIVFVFRVLAMDNVRLRYPPMLLVGNVWNGAICKFIYIYVSFEWDAARDNEEKVKKSIGPSIYTNDGAAYSFCRKGV